MQFRTSLKFKLKVFVQKIKLFAFSGKRLLRVLLTMFPAAEKTLSEGTEVEGAHKCFLGMQENFGNLCSFTITISKGYHLDLMAALLNNA